MSTLILHAGMHKTGSTAIQNTLAGLQDRDFHYFDWTEPNHSLLFTLLFEDNPETYFAFRDRGLTAEDAQRERALRADIMRSEIVRLRARAAVFSAERMSSAPDAAIERMRNVFAEQFSDMRVYLYVRPPVGFIESFFQQNAKTGGNNWALPWPNYKGRIARFDRLFGAGNVNLRIYRRNLLVGGDAVADFLDWTGLAGTRSDLRQDNRSLNAAALALVFAYRRAMRGQPRSPEQAARDRGFLQRLEDIKSPPFCFDRDLLRAEIASRRGDLDWIEDRLGAPLHEESDLDLPPGAVAIGSDDDFMAQAALHAAELDPLDGGAGRHLPLEERLRAIGLGNG